MLFFIYYYELIVLDEILKGLKNIYVGVVEKDGEVVFFYKMMEGFVDKSYGIYVVKIVGLLSLFLEWVVIILFVLEVEEIMILILVYYEEVLEVYEEIE